MCCVLGMYVVGHFGTCWQSIDISEAYIFFANEQQWIRCTLLASLPENIGQLQGLNSAFCRTLVLNLSIDQQQALVDSIVYKVILDVIYQFSAN